MFKQYYTFFHTFITHTCLQKIQTALLMQHYRKGTKLLKGMMSFPNPLNNKNNPHPHQYLRNSIGLEQFCFLGTLDSETDAYAQNQNAPINHT